MEQAAGFLQENEFLAAIHVLPLVAIDLIVSNPDRKILLGKRTNPPAKGFWFVPGGRIYKDEKIAAAFERISSMELGTHIEIQNGRFSGVYEHLHEDNFAGVPDLTTHYINLAFKIKWIDSTLRLSEDQHSSYDWWEVDRLLASPEVHPYTKAYFFPQMGYHPDRND